MQYTLSLTGAMLAFALIFVPASSDASERSIAGHLFEQTELTTMMGLTGIADEMQNMDTGGPFTVFAPSNAAFAKLTPEVATIVALRPEILSSLFSYHVVDGTFTEDELTSREFIQTTMGESVEIEERDGDVYVNDAKIVTSEIDASNGVVYIIDTVLVPHSAELRISRIVDNLRVLYPHQHSGYKDLKSNMQCVPIEQ
jgi:uncharacterized surface protein with fasciclin (FAS1) repeats